MSIFQTYTRLSCSNTLLHIYQSILHLEWPSERRVHSCVLSLTWYMSTDRYISISSKGVLLRLLRASLTVFCARTRCHSFSISFNGLQACSFQKMLKSVLWGSKCVCHSCIMVICCITVHTNTKVFLNHISNQASGKTSFVNVLGSGQVYKLSPL